jgi:predicted transcriptional regulator
MRWVHSKCRLPTSRCERADVSTAKEEVRKLLEQIPDDASFEDIQYHIYVCQKIERGLKDIEEGHVLSQEEAERRMSKWLGR